MKPTASRLVVVCLLAITSLIGNGCSEDKIIAVTEFGTFIFNFDHVVGGAALVLGSGGYPYSNQAGNAYNVTELQYYVSNFRLHRANGTSVGTDEVHFRDESVASTRGFTFSGVPAGTYTAISFTMGVDARRNVNGGLLPKYNNITWPDMLGGGYHNMILNGNYNRGGTTNTSMLVHTGRRMIPATAPDPTAGGQADPPGPDATAHNHHFTVYLAVASFTIADGDTWSTAVNMNLNGWFMNPVFNLEDFFNTTSMSIMPKLPAQELLMDNGVNGNVFSAGSPTKI
jgi:hypothetical protein